MHTHLYKHTYVNPTSMSTSEGLSRQILKFTKSPQALRCRRGRRLPLKAFQIGVLFVTKYIIVKLMYITSLIYFFCIIQWKSYPLLFAQYWTHSTIPIVRLLGRPTSSSCTPGSRHKQAASFLCAHHRNHHNIPFLQQACNFRAS
jgi:hypothetical protein